MNIVTLNSTSQLLDIYRYRLGSTKCVAKPISYNPLSKS